MNNTDLYKQIKKSVLPTGRILTLSSNDFPHYEKREKENYGKINRECNSKDLYKVMSCQLSN